MAAGKNTAVDVGACLVSEDEAGQSTVIEANKDWLTAFQILSYHPISTPKKASDRWSSGA